MPKGNKIFQCGYNERLDLFWSADSLKECARAGSIRTKMKKTLWISLWGFAGREDRGAFIVSVGTLK